MEKLNSIMMQSNALRGDYKNEIVNKTIKEIHDDIVTVFGPGACDAYITKDGQPYYTRDGLEVLESLTFDNKLAEYIRKMIFQAAYDQGKKVGDGTTTMIIFYTNLYRAIRDKFGMEYPISWLREIWNSVVEELVNDLHNKAVPLSKKNLLSMLYTCTQDKEFTAKVYHKLADAILQGAYIIPKKSNIESDLEVETYMEPLVKATRQFTIRPIKTIEPNTVIFHCNGMLDIVHEETYYGLMTLPISKPLEITSVDNGPTMQRYPLNIVILCNGVSEATRQSTKKFVKFLKDSFSDNELRNENNVAIYTLDNYRGMTNDAIEDLSTILTDEVGIGGLVNSLTFETYLYQAFSVEQVAGRKIDDLETFDCDLHNLDKLREMVTHFYPATFDDVEGIKIGKELGPNAQRRYDILRKEIEEEKSESRKYALQKRLQQVYGQFIEVQVGSRLIKDSQRKFELFLDMIISASEASKTGVLTSNSILNAIRIIDQHMDDVENDEPEETPEGAMVYNPDDDSSLDKDKSVRNDILEILLTAMNRTLYDMASNIYYLGDYDEFDGILLEHVVTHNIEEFDMTRYTFDQALPEMDVHYEAKKDEVEIDGAIYEIEHTIVEPVGVMENILRNSTLMLELALARTIHVDTFMMNYL